jgi:hypothetical protein
MTRHLSCWTKHVDSQLHMLPTKAYAREACKMRCMQVSLHIRKGGLQDTLHASAAAHQSALVKHAQAVQRMPSVCLMHLCLGSASTSCIEDRKHGCYFSWVRNETMMLPSQVWECYYMLFLSITEPKLHMRKTSCNHHGVVCQVLLLSQRPSWSSTGALAEEAAAEGVFFLQGEEEDDSKRRAARLQRGMFMHPNLTLAAALGKPVQLCRVWPA